MADGQLNEGQADSFEAKLQLVLDMIDADLWNAVAGGVEAFINHVQAGDGTILTHEEAEWLIGLAELILQDQP